MVIVMAAMFANFVIIIIIIEVMGLLIVVELLMVFEFIVTMVFEFMFTMVFIIIRPIKVIIIKVKEVIFIVINFISMKDEYTTSTEQIAEFLIEIVMVNTTAVTFTTNIIVIISDIPLVSIKYCSDVEE